MKKSTFLINLLLMAWLAIPLGIQAQYFVNFEGEGETKTAYASGDVILSGMEWNMTEALIGTLDADWKNGERSARMRGYAASAMTMLESKSNGLGEISFYYRRYGTDTQVDWKVEYSTDGGSSWTQAGSSFTAPASDEVQQFTAAVNVDGNVRVRIKRATEEGAANRRLNIDDILLTDFGEPLPEPSSYPTNFAAAAEGFGARLSWTDAVGEQLPNAYLIIGVMAVASKTVPVFPPEDGTAVPDNMDITLGYISKNVPYGLEEYTFKILESNSGYEFTIYPYTNSGSNIDYKTDGTPPTASVTTNNLSIILNETFDEDLGVMSAYSVAGEQEWIHDNLNYYARINGYSGGQFYVNEDWLISPALNLSLYKNIKLNFNSAQNFTGPELQLMISENYNGTGDPNDFSWTEYTDAADWSAGNYVWVNSGDIALNLNGAQTYIAFKYTSTEEDGAAWQVDDILVYGEALVGLGEISQSIGRVYPNPATDFIFVESANQMQLKVTDLSGRTLLELHLSEGKNQLDISSLPAGSYVVVMRNKQGEVSVTKLLKK
jgi:hypothetical protein